MLIRCLPPSIPPLVFPGTTATVSLMKAHTVCQQAATVVVAANWVEGRLWLVIRTVATRMARVVTINVQ